MAGEMYYKKTIVQILKEIFKPFAAIEGGSDTYADRIDACAEQWYLWKDTDLNAAREYRTEVRNLLWQCLGGTQKFEKRANYVLYSDVWDVALKYLDHYTNYKLPCDPCDVRPSAVPFDPTEKKFTAKCYMDIVSRFYGYFMLVNGAIQKKDSENKRYYEMPSLESDFCGGDEESVSVWEAILAGAAAREPENEHMSNPEKLALAESERDWMTAAMYNLMLSMINLWKHLPLRQRSAEKVDYYRTFYADTISAACHGEKAQAHMARCREHENELFKAMEELFLDFTLVESCRTIDQLIQSHYKPYSELTDKKVVKSENGYTPNAIFLAFFDQVKARKLAASTISEQREAYKEFIRAQVGEITGTEKGADEKHGTN